MAIGIHISTFVGFKQPMQKWDIVLGIGKCILIFYSQVDVASKMFYSNGASDTIKI